MSIVENPWFLDCFGDERLDRRASSFVEALVERQTAVVRQLASTRAEQVAYYRMLNNPRLDALSIIDQATGQCRLQAEQLRGQHILVLSDTTEINLESHAGRIKPGSGLGRVGNNRDLGLFIHASLAMAADSGRCLGFADIQYWTRQHQGSSTAGGAHKKRPIEQKESYRWLTAVNQSKSLLQHASLLTVVADAEADIYEQWARVVDQRTHLVIAARGERRIVEGNGLLLAYLAEQRVLDTCTLELRGDPRKKHQRRSARVELRSARVTVRRPGHLPADRSAASVTLTAISLKERAETIPAGSHGVDWMLLTTHAVDDRQQIDQLIGWYVKRWNIEQLFRTLKRQGFNIESSQMENGQALIRLSVLTLIAALRVMVLLLGREGDDAQSVEDIFSDEQQACLSSIDATLSGSSKASRNPHPPRTVIWAAWIIARLGGWKAVPSERPPGPITFFRGLRRFEQMYEGWRLALAP